MFSKFKLLTRNLSHYSNFVVRCRATRLSWVKCRNRRFYQMLSRNGFGELAEVAIKSSVILPLKKRTSRNDFLTNLKADNRSSEVNYYRLACEIILVTLRIIVIATVASGLYVFYWITQFTGSKAFPGVLLKAIEFLGPTFVKLGQWIATRRDLFPEDICKTLSHLQRQTTAHSWMYTKHLLEVTFGPAWKELFVRINKVPIGSGCCAQVYQAWIDQNIKIRANRSPLVSNFVEIAEYFCLGRVLEFFQHSGYEVFSSDNLPYRCAPVAVKVLHPGVESQIKRDLSIMYILASTITFLLPNLQWLSIRECVAEFSEIMENQVNLELEAVNLMKFKKNFTSKVDVVFPHPYVNLTHKRLLVESFHEGTNISDFLEVQDYELRNKLAKIGVTTALKMIFEDNFVHCDLHPGNILVQEVKESETFADSLFGRNKNPRIVILDCGLVTSLNDVRRKNLQDVFRSVVNGDGALAGEYIMKHSSHMTPDPEGFKETIKKIVETYLKKGVSLDNINVGSVMSELFAAMIKYEVKQDGSFSSVILSMAVIEGLGRSLDPGIDLINEMMPYVIFDWRTDYNRSTTNRASRNLITKFGSTIRGCRLS